VPVSYTVSTDGSFVWATVIASLTPEELYEYEQKTAIDERIRPGFRELFDVTQTDQVEVTKETMEQVRNLSAVNPKKGKGNQLAIVARGQSFDHARYYEYITAPNLQNVIVFNNLNTALLWLGVSIKEANKMACRQE